jgi:hypothetical protein
MDGVEDDLRMLIVTKAVGQEEMEKYLGSGQGPNWAVEPLVVVGLKAKI